jgi:hypothetical protein
MRTRCSRTGAGAGWFLQFDGEEEETDSPADTGPVTQSGGRQRNRSSRPLRQGRHRQCRGQAADRIRRGWPGSDEVQRLTRGTVLSGPRDGRGDLGSGSCPGPSDSEYARLKIFFIESGIRFVAAADILTGPLSHLPSVAECR